MNSEDEPNQNINSHVEQSGSDLVNKRLLEHEENVSEPQEKRKCLDAQLPELTNSVNQESYFELPQEKNINSDTNTYFTDNTDKVHSEELPEIKTNNVFNTENHVQNEMSDCPNSVSFQPKRKPHDETIEPPVKKHRPNIEDEEVNAKEFSKSETISEDPLFEENSGPVEDVHTDTLEGKSPLCNEDNDNAIKSEPKSEDEEIEKRDELLHRSGTLGMSAKPKVKNLRRNIRDILAEEKLDEHTLAAQKEEQLRLQRLQEKRAAMREYIEKQEVERFVAVVAEAAEAQDSNIKSEPPEDEAVDVKTKMNEDDEDIVILSSEDEDNKSTVKQEYPSQKPAHAFRYDANDDESDESDTESDGDETIEKKGKSDDSDSDVVVLSNSEEEDDEDENNSGAHINDAFNTPDVNGRVLVNVGHPEQEEDIFLAPQLAVAVKPHQIGGIRFLYDNIVESLGQFKTTNGFGCILAHSMGLGKTLQVISLTDVFLRHTGSRSVLIIVPINTIQNWLSEYNNWLPDEVAPHMTEQVRPRLFRVFVLNDGQKTMRSRAKVVKEWHEQGGVLLMGYELYRQLSLKKPKKPKKSKKRNDDLVDIEEEDVNKELLEEMNKALVNPGPDLVICDEGHRIKNAHANISQALKSIRTKRRIVLTGYPLQNSLIEYWCMVDFVRPNYLGNKAEFCNMFERPIQNGQCVDSTAQDVKIMRYRAHVLHSLLEGFVQRRGHSVLERTLPPKFEHVLLCRLKPIQKKLYKEYMAALSANKGMANPLKAFAICCKIWNHPDILYNLMMKRINADFDLDIDEICGKPGRPKKKLNKIPEKVPDARQSVPSWNPVRSEAPPTSFPSNNSMENPSMSTQMMNGPMMNMGYSGYSGMYNMPVQNYNQMPYSWNFNQGFPRTPQNEYYNNSFGSYNQPESQPEYPASSMAETNQILPNSNMGFEQCPPFTSKPNVPPGNSDQINTYSSQQHNGAEPKPEEPEVDKSEEKNDIKKEEVPLQWAESIFQDYVPGVLDNSTKFMIFFKILEECLKLNDRLLVFSQSLFTLSMLEEFLQKTEVYGTNELWVRGKTYFRLDGSTTAMEREKLINEFNNNINVRLFLVSTRAGSLGINLVGANRVVVFDASFNPCHDTQAVCRVYRYGQKKKCHIYRLVTDFSLEKRIYDRQINKQGIADRIVDEMNPDAHLSSKEISNLLVEKEEEPETDDFKVDFDKIEDPIFKAIVTSMKPLLTKPPFTHESLLVDRKDKKLSSAEKRLAKRSYEIEKQANTNGGRSSYTGIYQKTGSGGIMYTKTVGGLRPLDNDMSKRMEGGRIMIHRPNILSKAASSTPVESLAKQGVSVQQITVPKDVSIPTNSTDSKPIQLKAGQSVMVIKTQKGMYLRLTDGKIVAIRIPSGHEDAFGLPLKQGSVTIVPSNPGKPRDIRSAPTRRGRPPLSQYSCGQILSKGPNKPAVRIFRKPVLSGRGAKSFQNIAMPVQTGMLKKNMILPTPLKDFKNQQKIDKLKDEVKTMDASTSGVTKDEVKPLVPNIPKSEPSLKDILNTPIDQSSKLNIENSLKCETEHKEMQMPVMTDMKNPGTPDLSNNLSKMHLPSMNESFPTSLAPEVKESLQAKKALDSIFTNMTNISRDQSSYNESTGNSYQPMGPPPAYPTNQTLFQPYLHQNTSQANESGPNGNLKLWQLTKPNESFQQNPNEPYSHPNESYQQSKPNEPYPKPCESYQHLKPAEPYQHPKPGEPYQHPKPGEPYQHPKPGEPYQHPKSGEPYPLSKPTEPYHLPKPNESYQLPKPSEPYQHPKPSEPYLHNKPNESYQLSKPSETYQQPKHNELFEQKKTNDSYQPSKSNESYQLTKPNEPFHVPKTNESYHMPKPNDNFILPPPSSIDSFNTRFMSQSSSSSTQNTPTTSSVEAVGSVNNISGNVPSMGATFSQPGLNESILSHPFPPYSSAFRRMDFPTTEMQQQVTQITTASNSLQPNFSTSQSVQNPPYSVYASSYNNLGSFRGVNPSYSPYPPQFFPQYHNPMPSPVLGYPEVPQQNPYDLYQPPVSNPYGTGGFGQGSSYPPM